MPHAAKTSVSRSRTTAIESPGEPRVAIHALASESTRVATSLAAGSGCATTGATEAESSTAIATTAATAATLANR